MYQTILLVYWVVEVRIVRIGVCLVARQNLIRVHTFVLILIIGSCR